MLLLTGTFRGEEYEEKIVSADTLATRFNLKQRPKEGETLSIKLHPTKVVRDLAGNLRYPGSAPALAVQQVNIGQDSFTLRFTESFRRNETTGMKIFSTDLIPFSGQGVSFGHQGTDYERYLMFALNPLTEGSPNQNTQKMPMWKIYDPLVEERQQQAKAELTATCIQTIGGSQPNIRKFKAVSMGLDGPTEATVYTNLINAAIANPEAFWKAWNNRDLELRGKILMLVQDATLATEIVQGANAWFWKKGQYEGQRIVFCSGASDEVEELVTFITQSPDASHRDTVVAMYRDAYTLQPSQEVPTTGGAPNLGTIIQQISAKVDDPDDTGEDGSGGETDPDSVPVTGLSSEAVDRIINNLMVAKAIKEEDGNVIWIKKSGESVIGNIHVDPNISTVQAVLAAYIRANPRNFTFFNK